jgi:hypothetical protein
MDVQQEHVIIDHVQIDDESIGHTLPDSLLEGSDLLMVSDNGDDFAESCTSSTHKFKPENETQLQNVA